MNCSQWEVSVLVADDTWIQNPSKLPARANGVSKQISQIKLKGSTRMYLAQAYDIIVVIKIIKRCLKLLNSLNLENT